MDFNIIRNGYEETQGKKKINKILIFLIIGAILLLAFGGSKKENKGKDDVPQTVFNFEEYKNGLKDEAESALSHIKGAGSVKVVLSFDSRGKTLIARNNQSKTEKDMGTSDTKESKESSDSVVVYGQGQSETPYVTEEKLPIPSGVLVIASGAGNESVRLELYEAVKALYGISSHRIKVTALKKENN